MSDKKLILVIDDEPDIVTYLTTLLEDNGYEVATAANGQEGLEMAKDKKPAAISLDISMPEKSGVKFYREICDNEATKGIPVIIVTGLTKDFKGFIESRKQVPKPFGYVSKPIDKEEFLGFIKKAVG